MRCLLLFLPLACLPASADEWELSLYRAGQVSPAQGARPELSTQATGVRAGYRLAEDDSLVWRLEGAWQAKASASFQEDPAPGRTSLSGWGEGQAVSLALRAESWFGGRAFCLSGSVEERLNSVEARVFPAGGTGTKQLPQTWAFVGLGGRIWFNSALDGRAGTRSWYPILRAEWGMALGARGRGPAAEWLPRQAFILSWGMRF